MEINRKILKDYCKHIMDKYILVNPNYENSKLYTLLKEFYETGCAKDMISRNTHREIKAEWLGFMANEVNKYYKVQERKRTF